jgi:hypothetical protein
MLAETLKGSAIVLPILGAAPQAPWHDASALF